MLNTIVISGISAILFLFIGLVIGSKEILPCNFFDINIYHVFNIIVTVYLGVVFAYFLNHRNSKIARKKEFIIKSCTELNEYLDNESHKIFIILTDFSNESDKKQILLYFKVIGNKINVIKRLEFQKCIQAVTSIEKICETYKEKITGNEWGIRTSFDQPAIDGFRKDVESIKSTLLNITVICINQ